MNMNTEPERTTEESQDEIDLFDRLDDEANADRNPDVGADTIGFVPADQNADGGSEIEQLHTKLADAEKRVLMAHADLENFRRRTRRDTQDQLKYASLKMMSDLLDALDNLNRAVDSHQNEEGTTGLLEGVNMVAGQISAVLENHGCKKIEALGEPFDPNLHQAIQMQASDEYPEQTVMQELRSGYRLHDRVVRPSQVFVSTGPA